MDRYLIPLINNIFQLFKFNNTNMVLHPELGIIDLDLAITKSIQPLNPLKLNSTILHNKIVDEIANKTPNFTMRIKNWLHNDPSRGDYAVDTLKKIISQYNLLNAYKQNSYYKSICNSTDIDINDKDYFQDFENRLKQVKCQLILSKNFQMVN
ncbi:hypothetical protein OCF84_21095 (plasmid) [Shewanella xiamenensis]|uniref:hypothetical protein n=1 Tax=Shewanella xiamenensis TaxID=332186 RepID=UPI0024AD5C26|nr:hypothetical protein [Shewanella xiamenensis]WHF57755.1 hypothetical protein OCF84_21095 [Shewanella xiamenensis]